MQPFGETYILGGLAWGWRTLSQEAPFTEAAKNPNARDIMLVMTDGANTKSLGGTGSTYNGLFHNGSSQEDADLLSAKMCNDIKNSNIEIFTIAFEVDDETTKSLLQNCASSSDYFYDASDSKNLENAFESIGGKISKIKLIN